MKSNAVDLGKIVSTDDLMEICRHFNCPCILLDTAVSNAHPEPITEDAEFEIIEPKQLPETI